MRAHAGIEQDGLEVLEVSLAVELALECKDLPNLRAPEQSLLVCRQERDEVLPSLHECPGMKIVEQALVHERKPPAARDDEAGALQDLDRSREIVEHEDRRRQLLPLAHVFGDCR